MVATYEGPAGQAAQGYHFHLTDWLGTNRMQVSPIGLSEETCTSYPFGDGLSCTGLDATEHHFTQKERDAESGLDYFGARYFTSNLGRFMSPDWADAPTSVPYADFGDPQSLNLYAYVGNNPNTGIDMDGHWGPVGPQWGDIGYVGAAFIDGVGWGAGPSHPSADFANGEAGLMGYWAIAGAPKPKKPKVPKHKAKATPRCNVVMPTGTSLTMVQTLMGEQTSEAKVGTNQYADDESGRQVGSPGGAEITDATLDQEADLMAGTMLNLGHIGNSGTYRGLPAGRMNAALALKSANGSGLCSQLKRDINAVNTAQPSAFSQWRAVNQGGSVRQINGATRVAGTDFF
jgi:RHS repeat-associated protein